VRWSIDTDPLVFVALNAKPQLVKYITRWLHYTNIGAIQKNNRSVFICLFTLVCFVKAHSLFLSEGDFIISSNSFTKFYQIHRGAPKFKPSAQFDSLPLAFVNKNDVGTQKQFINKVTGLNFSVEIVPD